MCRSRSKPPFALRARGAALAAAAALGLLAVPTPARGDDDPVIDYLQRHGLTDLVVARLEARFREALGDDRIPLAERLAVLYGQMLDETDDESQRAVWEKRSRDMLEQVPRANTEALRMTIHKASYLRAERIAERHRLRRADEAERVVAVRLMGEVSAAMSENHALFRDRIRRLETADAGASAPSASVEDQLRELDQLAMQAAYYDGWARYYQAWLTGSTVGLDEAMRSFGWLLHFAGAMPNPEEAPVSLLVHEHLARAAVGIALCQAQAGRPQTGLAWLDLVEESSAESPPILAILPGYRLVILFASRQWPAIAELVETWKSGKRLNVTLVRLLAVLALEQSQVTGDAQARQLGETAVNLLAEMGELRQVIEIADVFRLDTLGGDSFILAYVPAIKAYERARSEHDSEDPATQPAHVALYKEAEEKLAATAQRRDAAQWPDAARHARLLVAWSRYFQNRLDSAATLFEEISTQSTGDESESALWMSIVCRERLASAGDSPAAVKLRTALESFLDRFPSSARAGRVRLRLVTAQSADPSLQSVEELLAIPPGSDVYATARNEAERRLFLLFREAPLAQRLQYAQRYLDVAMPLLEADERRAFIGGGEAEARQAYLQRARRMLDVLLTRGVARVTEARRILDRLETARAAGLIDLAAVAEELDYRRFQAQILSGGFDEAARWCEELWRTDPDSAFAQSASRALYAYALQDWHTFENDPRLEQTLRRVILHGRRALRGAGDPPATDDPADVAVMINVADAALALDRLVPGGEAQARSLAEQWFDLLIAAQPRHFRVLRGAAVVAEARGDADDAVQHWRTAMNGSAEASAEWFEAKYNFIRLLAGQDSRRAGEILEQHVVLYPQYGPEPWGERLKALHAQVKSGGGR